MNTHALLALFCVWSSIPIHGMVLPKFMLSILMSISLIYVILNRLVYRLDSKSILGIVKSTTMINIIAPGFVN